MPVLHIDLAPRMTRYLVEANAFGDDPLVLVDVGARGGVESHWAVFGDQVRVLGFEPDAAECARLNAASPPGVEFLPHALGAVRGEREFTVTRHAASCSFYPADPGFSQRFIDSENLEVVDRVTIPVEPLDAVLEQSGIADVDFVKLDAEGAELDILMGAEALLAGPSVLGLVSEVRFPRDLNHCPVFSDLDTFVTQRGLRLYDLDLYRHARRVLPQPFLYDFRDEAGRPVPGPTISGQVLWGDALYLRDPLLDGKPEPLSTRRALKLACLFEVHGLPDCAAEIVVRYDEAIGAFADPDHLLDLLTPEIKGVRLSYREHLESTQRDLQRFRPAGRRFPEHLVGEYDGRFVPSWMARRPSVAKRILRTGRRWLSALRG